FANGNPSGAGAPGDGLTLRLEGPGQLAALLLKFLEEGLRLDFDSRQPRGSHFSQAFLVVGSPRLGVDFDLATDRLQSSRSFLGGSTDRPRGRVGAVFRSCRFLQEGLGHLAATLFEALKESIGLTLEPLRALARQFRESPLVRSHVIFQAELRLLPYRLQT